MDLPNDNFIALSIINTKLRNGGITLSEFCLIEGLDIEDLLKRFESVGYLYCENENAFKPQ